MEEGVSAKVTAAAVLCRGAAGGAAGALLYDGGGAVGGRAHDGLTLHFTPLATTNLTLLVSCLPSIAVLEECSFVGTFLFHVFHQLLIPDLLPKVPQVAGDDLQVIPGVSWQTGLGRVDTIQPALDIK